MVRSMVIWCLKLLLRLVYRVQVQGIEHLQHSGERVLIVANHTSFLDAVLLSVFLPDNISYAIHSSYFHKWWMNPIKSWVRLFAVDHADPMAMKSLIKHVKAGNKVVIFPEGRITATGSLMKVYPGPGMVADKADAEILPIRIDGAQYTPFSHLRGQVRLRWFPKIKLTILPSHHLDFDKDMGGRERRQKAGKILADIMIDMIFETTVYRRRVWDALIEAAATHGHEHIVLEDIERNPLTYRELMMRAFLLGDVFQSQAKLGEHVGILLPNTSACAISVFALQSNGMIPTMLNYTMGQASAIAALETADIQTVITSRSFIEQAGLDDLLQGLEKHAHILFLEDVKKQLSVWGKLSAWFSARYPARAIARRLASVRGDQPAMVLFTSGSEGVPKGVVLSHQNLLANVAQLKTSFDFNTRDVCLNAMPLFHSFGMMGGMMLPLLSGMRLFLYPSPLHYRAIPEIAYDINATLMFGTNVFLAGYAKHAHPYDFYSLRVVLSGAEKLQDETRQIWMEKFGIRIFEAYGATEASPGIATNTPMHFKAGTVGRFFPGLDYRLENVPGIDVGGRLWVKGPNIMAGYLLHDTPNTVQSLQDGWYDTGDIVSVDEDGFVTIQGRLKRFAKIAGEMVSLAAVEDIANQCWADATHAALAIHDASKGEQLVLMTTEQQAERKVLQAYAKAHGVNELQVPKKYVVVDEIPLFGTGKINYPAAQTLLVDMLNDE